LDGLNATNRKNDWGLSRWPGWYGLANASKKRYNIHVAFELVNQQGLVIGKQTVRLNPTFEIISGDNDLFTMGFDKNYVRNVYFNSVNANDITDNLTVRIATVNDEPPQKARITITAMPLFEKTPPLTDFRDDKRYNTVRIGTTIWMAENLNYLPQTGNSWCYNNDNSNCNKYGRLYDWNTAKGICPSGWYLPSSEDWGYLTSVTNLINMNTGKLAGEKLKAQNGWNGTNDYGFSALPGGIRRYYGFNGIGNNGTWWAAITSWNIIDAWNMDNDHSFGITGPHSSDRVGYSVRCVKDDTQMWQTNPMPMTNSGDMPTSQNKAVPGATQSATATASPTAKIHESTTATSTASQPSPTSEKNDPVTIAKQRERIDSMIAATIAHKKSGKRPPAAKKVKEKEKEKEVGNEMGKEVLFDPSSFYFFANLGDVDFRIYENDAVHRNRTSGGFGFEAYLNKETISPLGFGPFLGGETFGDDGGMLVLGIELRELLWIVKKHLAAPISLGFSHNSTFTHVEKRNIAEFIDAMSEFDKVSDEKLNMTLSTFDLTPAIGLQIFFNRTISIYAGYAYNATIPIGCSVRYRVPGKYYPADDKGDYFQIPKESAPIQNIKESFMGMPGALRLALKFHVNN